MKYLFMFLLLTFPSIGAVGDLEESTNKWIDPKHVVDLVFRYTEDTVPAQLDRDRELGVDEVRATVILNTSEYNMWNCRNESEQDRKGFYIARINNTDTFILYCGTTHNEGVEITIELDTGI